MNNIHSHSSLKKNVDFFFERYKMCDRCRDLLGIKNNCGLPQRSKKSFMEKKMHKKLLALAAGAALITAAQNGFAGTLGASSMDYSVTLADACTAASASGQSYGPYATNTPDLLNQGAGGINVICPAGLNYRIMVDGGLNSTGATRQLSDGAGNNITYTLYDQNTSLTVGDANPLDPAYTPVGGHSAASWANGIDGTGNNWGNWHPLVADILISSAPAGTYNDSVGVVVTW
ncbi:MAG: spore coat protein U domain-containing protein [Candidatus Electronema sp. VV]